MNEARVEFFHDADGEWRWRAKAENGRIVATSGEGYTNKDDCLDGCKKAMRILTGATLIGLDT